MAVTFLFSLPDRIRAVDLLADDELEIQARRLLPPSSLHGATSSSK
jgi:hypothetical protein